MVVKGRQISHGAAYSDYAAMKDKAIYIGGEHLDTDAFIISSAPDLEEIWGEFEYEGSMYSKGGKDIKNTIIALEASPTPEELKSLGINSDEETLTNEQKESLFKLAQETLDNMDVQEIPYSYTAHIKQKDEYGRVIRDSDGNPITKDEIKKGIVPKTNLRNSKWFCMLHRDSESGIWHLHFVISRFTYGGLGQNDPRLIAKRAARAAEMINQKHGWVSAESISEGHRKELVNTIYDVLRNMDKFSWNNFKDAMEARTFTDYKGEVQNYELMFRNDSKGNVVGYSVWRGNSNFNASKIGKQLTASRLYNTWQKLQNEKKQKDKERGKFKAKAQMKPVTTQTENRRKNVVQSQQEKEARSAVNKAVQVLEKFCGYTFNVFGREEMADLHEGIVGQCLLGGRDTTQENLKEAVNELVGMVDGIANQTLKATNLLMEFVTDMAMPAAVPSVGGGGGGQDDDGWRGKKDDEWWNLWKPVFAKFKSRGRRY